MKNIILKILIAVTAITASAQKTYDRFQIQVDGLGCPFCAYGLEKKFKEFNGIKKITIDIETGNFEFQYPSTTALTMDNIVDQVKKAGYTPKKAVISRHSGAIEELTVASSTNNKKEPLETLLVSGNCDMCKSRIEAAALSIPDIDFAVWNKDSKILEYQAKPSVSKEEISQKIAEAGHDNALIKADLETYENLPPCCTYRKK